MTKTSDRSFLDPVLFVGIPITPPLEAALKETRESLVTLFTQGGEYLAKLRVGESLYLGKECPSHLTLTELERVEAHVLSLLRRLAPSYSIDPQSLTIFGQ